MSLKAILHNAQIEANKKLLAYRAFEKGDHTGIHTNLRDLDGKGWVKLVNCMQSIPSGWYLMTNLVDPNHNDYVSDARALIDRYVRFFDHRTKLVYPLYRKDAKNPPIPINKDMECWWVKRLLTKEEMYRLVSSTTFNLATPV